MFRGRSAVVFALLVVAALLAPAPVAAVSTAGATAPDTVTLVGAGDIAVCGSNERDTATAALVQDVLDADPTAIAFTAGDNVYPYGSTTYFASCYDPTWGAFKARTRPAPGNHEYYNTPGAAGYFEYFGARAGKDRRGWYRFMAGEWRVYSMNSEYRKSSKRYARQLEWLQIDLVERPHQCVMAIWHRPVFSTGEHGNSRRMLPVFQALYDAGADVVVTGHDHGYQRFMPADPSGAHDAVNGVRQFVAAAGGASLYDFPTDSEILEVRDNTSHGVLKLTLSAGSYSWEFVPVPGKTFTDSGSADCH